MKKWTVKTYVIKVRLNFQQHIAVFQQQFEAFCYHFQRFLWDIRYRGKKNKNKLKNKRKIIFKWCSMTIFLASKKIICFWRLVLYWERNCTKAHRNDQLFCNRTLSCFSRLSDKLFVSKMQIYKNVIETECPISQELTWKLFWYLPELFLNKTKESFYPFTYF